MRPLTTYIAFLAPLPIHTPSPPIPARHIIPSHPLSLQTVLSYHLHPISSHGFVHPIQSHRFSTAVTHRHNQEARRSCPSPHLHPFSHLLTPSNHMIGLRFLVWGFKLWGWMLGVMIVWNLGFTNI